MRILPLAFLLLASISLSFTTHAASAISASIISPGKASDHNPPSSLKEQLKVLQMRQFTKMTMSDYEKLTGKKLNFFQKMSFRLNKKRVETMLKAYDSGDSPTTLQKISWLLKGLILGPIALLIGYIFLQDEERELIKWIWFGFAGFAIAVAVILLTL